MDNVAALSVKDGGYPEFEISPISKRNMGSSSPMWDHSYCRVLSKQTERDSRLGVKKQPRLLGMEASSPVISENLSTDGNPRDRSICFQTISENLSTDGNPRDRSICFQTIISSDQDLLFMEAESIEPSSRCLPTKLVPQKSLCFPPFRLIPKLLSKVPKEKVPMIIFVTPAGPLQLRYPEAMRMSIQQPILFTWKRDLLKNPKGEIHSLVQNKTLKLMAWTVLLLNQEDHVLTQIMNWPRVNGLANINQILEFLSKLFQNELHYRTIAILKHKD